RLRVGPGRGMVESFLEAAHKQMLQQRIENVQRRSDRHGPIGNAVSFRIWEVSQPDAFFIRRRGGAAEVCSRKRMSALPGELKENNRQAKAIVFYLPIDCFEVAVLQFRRRIFRSSHRATEHMAVVGIAYLE